jgi:hypothetical protein
VLSACDAWAVGDYAGNEGGRTLIEHWNGLAWKQVASPDPGAGGSFLSSVSAISSDSIWAVGEYHGGAGEKTLILHWNGATWTHVTSPGPGGPSDVDVLSGVITPSATSAWAVGASTGETGDATAIVLRWNGSTWARVASPQPTDGSLVSVAAASPADIWAVGIYSASSLAYAVHFG